MSVRFYYDLNSPYAYLAALRVDDLVPADVEWVPIAFGPLLVQTQRVPWSLKPGEREEGMRDCERRAQERGLPPIVWPDGWPGESYSVNGARAALVAERQGRQREMAVAVFEQVFVHGRRLDDPATLVAAAERAGVEDVAAHVAADDVKQQLRAATDDAIARGVAGIPTVEVAGELFWGDDRLEDAARAAA